jgi:polyferredoxin
VRIAQQGMFLIFVLFPAWFGLVFIFLLLKREWWL